VRPPGRRRNKEGGREGGRERGRERGGGKERGKEGGRGVTGCHDSTFKNHLSIPSLPPPRPPSIYFLILHLPPLSACLRRGLNEGGREAGREGGRDARRGS